jgi:hypothetical protein
MAMGQAPVESSKAWLQTARLASGKNGPTCTCGPFPLWFGALLPYLTASHPLKDR